MGGPAADAPGKDGERGAVDTAWAAGPGTSASASHRRSEATRADERFRQRGSLRLTIAPVPFNHGNAPTGRIVAGFLLTLIPFVFLLMGSRVAWIVLLVIEVAALIFNMLVDPRWLVPIEVILIALLLAPSSRAFVWQRQWAQEV